jgi:hypothetical protein
MPASIAEVCARIVVERAYTIHSLPARGQRPGGTTGTHHLAPPRADKQ